MKKEKTTLFNTVVILSDLNMCCFNFLQPNPEILFVQKTHFFTF